MYGLFPGFWGGTVEMRENTSKSAMAVRYLVAGVLFLIVGIRFFFMGDPVGTTLYGAGAALLLLVACSHYMKRE
jgi:hypothetical protein